MKTFLFCALSLFSSLAFSMTPKPIPISTALTVTSSIVIRITADPATGLARYYWFKASLLPIGSAAPEIICMKYDLTQASSQPLTDDISFFMYLANNQSINVMTAEDASWCTQ